MKHHFDRPVFIMAAPRSCSTLLFETLAQSDALWSLGNESHHIFEAHQKLRPGTGLVESNRLTADLLDPALARAIPVAFAQHLHDHKGHPLHSQAQQGAIRLLEKTPKHCLRIPFLNALFPDALFIYLFRDPKHNISSIIDAWRSGRFVTYRNIRTAHGPWCLLLPPAWREQVNKPLEEIATYQWLSAHRHIISDLEQLAPSRWTAVNAEEMLRDPLSTVTRLCSFMGFGVDSQLHDYLLRPLPLSIYTVSIPNENKWLRNADLLARVLPRVAPMIAEINGFVSGNAQPLSLPTILPADLESQQHSADIASNNSVAATHPLGHASSRNQACPCGSGKRFKACHGQMRQ